MSWRNIETLPARRFRCGYCGADVAGDKAYRNTTVQRVIYACPLCDAPNYFDQAGTQVPGPAPGNDVASVPSDLNDLYREARRCCTISAFTSSVLACRKMLMNIAVAQGDQPGKTFVQYVDYLANAGYVPPNGRGWVDHIRRKGNEATHEIHVMTRADAEELISFVEMLLKFIYEFPARVPPAPAVAATP